jgi:hypothetical protein
VLFKLRFLQRFEKIIIKFVKRIKKIDYNWLFRKNSLLDWKSGGRRFKKNQNKIVMFLKIYNMNFLLNNLAQYFNPDPSLFAPTKYNIYRPSKCLNSQPSCRRAPCFRYQYFSGMLHNKINMDRGNSITRFTLRPRIGLLRAVGIIFIDLRAFN